jgi:hypothetical protein
VTQLEDRVAKLEKELQALRKNLAEAMPKLTVKELHVTGAAMLDRTLSATVVTEALVVASPVRVELASSPVGVDTGVGKLIISAPEHINVIIERTDTKDHMTLTVGSQGTGIHFADSNFFFISADPYEERATLGAGKKLIHIDANGDVTINGNLTVQGKISQGA